MSTLNVGLTLIINKYQPSHFTIEFSLNESIIKEIPRKQLQYLFIAIFFPSFPPCYSSSASVDVLNWSDAAGLSILTVRLFLKSSRDLLVPYLIFHISLAYSLYGTHDLFTPHRHSSLPLHTLQLTTHQFIFLNNPEHLRQQLTAGMLFSQEKPARLSSLGAF